MKLADKRKENKGGSIRNLFMGRRAAINSSSVFNRQLASSNS